MKNKLKMKILKKLKRRENILNSSPHPVYILLLVPHANWQREVLMLFQKARRVSAYHIPGYKIFHRAGPIAVDVLLDPTS